MYKSYFIPFFNAITLGFKLDHDDDDWVYTEEPHVTRRREILKKYPEIKKLMGSDPFISYIIIAEVLFQLLCCYVICQYPPGWYTTIFMAYFFGGFINHSLGSSIHEVGHNLAFGHKYPSANRFLSIFANLPMIIPIAISYRKYHHEHHRYLGHDVKDVDVPMTIEVWLFRNPLTKIIWLIINPFFQGMRPFCKSPKPVTKWEAFNIAIQMSFNYALFRFFGLQSIVYLFLSTALSLGLHPTAGHLLSEHYLYNGNQSTTSYYGPLNPILFNVGYHVEHHDFPYIPHTRLHLVHKIAPEYYEHLNYHTSWIKVIWDFIWMDHMGPQARSIINENLSRPQLYEDINERTKTLDDDPLWVTSATKGTKLPVVNSGKGEEDDKVLKTR